MRLAIGCRAASLLDDVRGLVRSQIEIRWAGEHDDVGKRKGRGADGFAGRRRRATDLRTDLRHVVMAERALDRFEVRQRAPPSGLAVPRTPVAHAGREHRVGRWPWRGRE